MNARNRRFIAVVLVLLAGGLAWRLAFRGAFRYAGTVEATEVAISPRVASNIAAVRVDEGDPVKAGQTLIELSCEDVRLATDIAERDYLRAARLFKEGSMNREAFEHAENRRDDAELRKSWCEIRSPIDGTVLARPHEPGEWASVGLKILELADLRSVYAYFYVPQPILARISLNMPVTAYLPELAMRPIHGRVESVRSEAEFTPKNVQTREERERLVYGVKVALDNSEGLLKPGMPVEADLPR